MEETSRKSFKGSPVQNGTLDQSPAKQEKGSRTVIAGAKRPAAAREVPADILADRYEVKGLAGEGGMGEVLIVHDRLLEREIALKRMLGEDLSSERVSRFVTEAQVTGRLEHPGIVPVHDLVTQDGRPYFTMKLMHGSSLGQVLGRIRSANQKECATYDLRRLVSILVSVCHAVAFAHARGVIHRDLKPDNIMVGDFGEVIVLDWGLARLTGATDSMRPVSSATNRQGTMEGSIAGTPGYMAPEQARGEISRLSVRTDVYALGAVLYECLTLAPPHKKADSLLTLKAVLTEPIVAPSRRVRNVPLDLEAACLKALAAEPANRYASVALLREDLEAWLADRPVSARKASAVEKAVLWARRNRQLSLGIVMGLGLSVSAGGAAWGRAAWLESRDRSVKQKTLEGYLAAAEAAEMARLEQTDPPSDSPVGPDVRPPEPLAGVSGGAEGALADASPGPPPDEGRKAEATSGLATGVPPMERKADSLSQAAAPGAPAATAKLSRTLDSQDGASPRQQSSRRMPGGSRRRPVAQDSVLRADEPGTLGAIPPSEDAQDGDGGGLQAPPAEEGQAESVPGKPMIGSNILEKKREGKDSSPPAEILSKPPATSAPKAPAAPAPTTARPPSPAQAVKPSAASHPVHAQPPRSSSAARAALRRLYEMTREIDPENKKACSGLAKVLLEDAEEKLSSPCSAGDKQACVDLARRARELDQASSSRCDKIEKQAASK